MLNKYYFSYLSNFIIFVIFIHLISSFFIGDSYTFTRILSNSIFSVTILFFIVKYNNLVVETLVGNKLIFLFLLTPILFTYFSAYINTEAEFYQHISIGITYFLIIFLMIFLTKNLLFFSLKRFLNTFLLINIMIFSFIFIYYLLFMEHISLLFTIKRFFSNIRFLNHLQTLLIPLLLCYYSFIKCKKSKLFIILLLVINFNLLFFTGARGSLYSIGISSFLILLVSNKNIKKDLFIFSIIIIFSILFYQVISGMFDYNSSHIEHLNSFSSRGRLEIYNTLLPYLIKVEHIFQPVGFASQDIAVYGFLHPHNILLFIFLGGGTFFLLIFLIILLNYLKNIWTTFSQRRNKIKTYFLFTFISLFIHSFVSGLYIAPLTLILVLYFFISFNKYCVSYKLFKQNSHFYIILKSFSICILLVLVLLNFLYLKKTQELYLKYKFTDEEIKDKYNNIRHRLPGIIIFDAKIIDQK